LRARGDFGNISPSQTCDDVINTASLAELDPSRVLAQCAERAPLGVGSGGDIIATKINIAGVDVKRATSYGDDNATFTGMRIPLSKAD
jgi:hypothetical protein